MISKLPVSYPALPIGPIEQGRRGPRRLRRRGRAWQPIDIQTS